MQNTQCPDGCQRMEETGEASLVSFVASLSGPRAEIINTWSIPASSGAAKAILLPSEEPRTMPPTFMPCVSLRMEMPSGGSYELYADLGRDHLVWVAYAAPELSLLPVLTVSTSAAIR